MADFDYEAFGRDCRYEYLDVICDLLGVSCGCELPSDDAIGRELVAFWYAGDIPSEVFDLYARH